MRIAAFNVENLFQRAKALNPETRAEGKPILEKHARINELINLPVYTDAVKDEIRELLLELGLEKRDDGGEWVILRQNRGKLVRRPTAGGLEIVADGREDWIGWVELKTEQVNELAMDHTAMVIRDVDADILGVVEAESRIVLDRFSAQLLQEGRRHAVRVRDGDRRQRRPRHRRRRDDEGRPRDRLDPLARRRRRRGRRHLQPRLHGVRGRHADAARASSCS